MAEFEEAFEGVFEFSVHETSKDLSQNRKLIFLKPEQETTIRDQSADRMPLQSIYQILVGVYMVTAVIISQKCFKVSEYTESLSFEGKGLKHFENM